MRVPLVGKAHSGLTQLRLAVGGACARLQVVLGAIGTDERGDGQITDHEENGACRLAGRPFPKDDASSSWKRGDASAKARSGTQVSRNYYGFKQLQYREYGRRITQCASLVLF